jgi:hypothetical protein
VANEDTVLSQYVPGFRANLNLAPQQLSTRLLGCIDGELNYDTPGQMFNADDVQVSDPVDVTARVPDTPDGFPGFTRRAGIFTPFQDAKWLDNVDKARELVDPTSKVMAAMTAGRWRKTDIAILGTVTGVGGLLGTAPTYAGAIGTTAISYTALPASQLVAATDIQFAHDAEVVPNDASQYGLSVGKVIHAGQLLDESELEGERYFAYTSQQKADLLRRTPVTSRFYDEVMALYEGKINSFMGFTFVRMPKTILPTDPNVAPHDGVSPVRACVAWVKNAVVYRGRPITEARIRLRPDKSDTPQAFYKAEHGAVRRYDTAVVQIDCYEGVQY